jgi:hypothetical protein
MSKALLSSYDDWKGIYSPAAKPLSEFLELYGDDYSNEDLNADVWRATGLEVKSIRRYQQDRLLKYWIET